MVTLVVLAEGATEREFISNTISPHLRAQQVFCRAIDLGGNVSIDKIRRLVPKALGEYDYATTLVDYYGFKGKGAMRVQELEDTIGAVGAEPRRFIPYVQQYEFESLLFSDPAVVSNVMKDPGKQLVLSRLVAAAGGAEEINDGYETCPSRRLLGIFPSFNKKLHGPEACSKIGIAALRAGCGRFNEWLTRLEALAG